MSGPFDPQRLAHSLESNETRLAEERREQEQEYETQPTRSPDLPEPVPATVAVSRGGRRRPLPKLADPDAPLLVVENLRTYFSLESGTVKAVDGVSFTLDYGEALGIAGESGCGKTTTALSLVRILPNNATIVEGSIRLMGIDLVPKSENARFADC